MSLSGLYAPWASVSLGNDDWFTSAVAEENGTFVFACLGEGIGFLNASFAENFTPLAPDIPVRTGLYLNREVNIGYYTGLIPPSPPFDYSLEFKTIQQGDGYIQRKAELEIHNALPQTLANAWLTFLIPPEYTIVNVESAPYLTDIWGNLITLDLGDITPYHTTPITIIITLKQDQARQNQQAPMVWFGYQRGATFQLKE